MKPSLTKIRHRLRVHVQRPGKGEDGTGLTDLQIRIFPHETKAIPSS